MESGDFFKLGVEDFQKVLMANKSELKVTHRLKEAHITLPEGFKTCVSGATQTMSNTTATAMEYFDPSLKNKADVVRLCNDVSDIH